MINYMGRVEEIQQPEQFNFEDKPEPITKEDLTKYPAKCTSVIYGKESKNPTALLNRLMTEAVDGKPSRPLEYIPCKVEKAYVITKLLKSENQFQMFGFFSPSFYYTNARELLNWGWSLDNVLDTVDFTNYKVFKCVAPYFIYGQISTHTQLTTVSHSQRYAESNLGYWKPNEIDVEQGVWDGYVETSSKIMLTKYMKRAGINRKEVYDRGADMLQYRSFTIGGYTNNPNAWDHFIKQRVDDNHTQLETREFCQIFKDLL